MAKPDKPAEDGSPAAVSRDVSLVYDGYETVPAMFADNFIVTHATGMFTFMFFQSQIPPIIDPAKYNALESVPAICVAKVIVTPALARQILSVFKGNLENFEQMQNASIKGREE